MIINELRRMASKQYAEEPISDHDRALLREHLAQLDAKPFEDARVANDSTIASVALNLLPRLLLTIDTLEEAIRVRIDDAALRNEIRNLIVIHSSPTIGRGDLHSGRAGFILYEREGLDFVITRLAAMIQPRAADSAEGEGE